MKKVVNKKIIYFVVIFLFLIFVAGINVIAKEKNIQLKSCTLSEEYLKWDSLSDEEKEKVIAPPMCDVDADKIDSENAGIMLLAEEEVLPSYFNGSEKDYVAKVKNQQDTGSCWAFSTTTALEYYGSKILNLNNEYSTRHIVYSTTREFTDGVYDYGFNKTAGSGGNFFMSSSYLINNLGPVLEDEMPFENNEDTISINSISGKSVQYDVNDVILNYDSNYGTACTQSEVSEIKNYVYNYGSVVISTYITSSILYYNSSNAAYYYNGSYSSNHAVAIVGWDDNYSKDNFSIYNKPSSDGAWIVQNSYGESFGKNGYYYISYEDVRVCDIYMVIKDADTDVEDNAYVYDTLGFNAFFGFSTDGSDSTSSYAMNVFEKNNASKEVLKEVTFGASGIGTYEIYYIEGDGSKKSVSNMQFIGSGIMDGMGYITYKLIEPVIIDSDVSQFSIVVYYEMVDSTAPLALSSSGSTFYQYITSESGRSFISDTGNTWYDLVDLSDDVLIPTIKAFTDDYVTGKVSSDTYTVDEENLIIYVQPNTDVDSFLINVDVVDDTYSIDKYSEYSGKVYTGFVFEGYTVVVFGDVNGDGFAKMNDVMMISKYIVDGVGLDSYYKLAADVNLDSAIKMNDVMKICSYIVEGGTL